MAYYCSMKCFNGDLMSHRKFCTTTPWDKNPVNKPKTPMVVPKDPPPQFKPTAPSPRPPRVEKAPEAPSADEDSEQSDESSVTSSSSSSSSTGSYALVQDEEDAVVEEVTPEEITVVVEKEDEEEPMIEVEEYETEDEEEATGQMGSLDIGDGDDNKGSAAQGGRKPLVIAPHQPLPDLKPFEREVVSLREISGMDPRELGWERPEWASASESFRELMELEPRHYDWEKPEWAIKSPLRKTAKGDLVKLHGDLTKPSLNGTVQVDGKEREWAKPEWVLKSPLRKTPLSDVIKNGGKLEKPTTHIREFAERNDIELDDSKNLSFSDSFS